MSAKAPRPVPTNQVKPPPPPAPPAPRFTVIECQHGNDRETCTDEYCTIVGRRRDARRAKVAAQIAVLRDASRKLMLLGFTAEADDVENIAEEIQRVEIILHGDPELTPPQSVIKVLRGSHVTIGKACDCRFEDDILVEHCARHKLPGLVTCEPVGPFGEELED